MIDYSQKTFQEIKEKINNDEKFKFKKTENNWIEYKASSNSINSNQICVFLNTSGGIIIIGIEENVGYKNLDDVTKNRILSSIKDKCDKYHCDLNEKNISIDDFENNGHKLILIRIHPMKVGFCVSNGSIYVKRNHKGESDCLKTKEEIQEFVMQRTKNEIKINEYRRHILYIRTQLRVMEEGYEDIKNVFQKHLYPKPLKLNDYKKMREFITPIIYNSTLYNIEQELFIKLRDIDSIIGNEHIHFKKDLIHPNIYKISNENFVIEMGLKKEKEKILECIRDIEALEKYINEKII